MINNIEKIEQPLRDKIINCALKEFAVFGYNKASFNNILKEAGISKGRFYQYIKSKNELYNYLIYNILEKLMLSLKTCDIQKETDLIERYRKFSYLSIDIYVKYPYLSIFAETLIKNTSVTTDFKRRYDDINKKLKYDGFDTSLLIDKTNLIEKINIIYFTITCIIKLQMSKWNYSVEKINKNDLIDEIDKHLIIFRKLYYK